MKVIWIGQGGFLFDNGRSKVMIDPYLSDSVGKGDPKFKRRLPIDESLFDVAPDIMVFTHDHADHYDVETAPRFFTRAEKSMTVLCPSSVWRQARANGGGHNYVQFDSGTEWTEGDLRISAVPAAHSDTYAIGVVVEDICDGKRYYVTGDTLYNNRIFAALPEGIDVIFLPINGVGNNMNMTDAARFAERVGARVVVPMHFGMFDSLDPEMMTSENKKILVPYKEYTI